MANENAVALKLPPFWISQPRVWFQQAEAQFALRNITADIAVPAGGAGGQLPPQVSKIWAKLRFFGQ